MISNLLAKSGPRVSVVRMQKYKAEVNHITNSKYQPLITLEKLLVRASMHPIYKGKYDNKSLFCISTSLNSG